MSGFADSFAKAGELLPLLAQGAVVTLKITAMSLVAAILVSFIAGTARLSGVAAIRITALGFLEIFRGTSLIVQLFFFYFILPLYAVRLSAETTAVLAIGLNLGAYGSEIVRSAIKSIGKGQIEAAKSLSLPRRITFSRVIFPQALMILLPSFGNLAIEIAKATALVSLITITDLTQAGHNLITATGETSLIWLTVLLIYLLINTPLNLFVAWAEKWAGRSRQGESGAV
ncbi:MAG TPA: ectoine/hydroxyectoine ABC transporter permease subunit EhuC [Nordella sp.]|nr:ectoine/hydroxyectoine ABC transporter permease subunit EhuC [Nordella sp.]